MFAHRTRLCKWQSLLPILVLAIALFAVAGCGDDGAGAVAGSTEGSAPTTSDEDAPPPDVADADPDDVQVIEDWSTALREGDVEAAAGYFAIPSTAENGTVIKIESPEDAIEFNTLLPCGAEVISARTEGDLTTATFRLTDRPGGDCGPGVGETASTSFDIQSGKIVEWRRIDEPPDPGDGGGGQGSPV